MADEVKEEVKKTDKDKTDMELVLESVDKILNAILTLQSKVTEAIAEKEVKSRAGRF